MTQISGAAATGMRLTPEGVTVSAVAPRRLSALSAGRVLGGPRHCRADASNAPPGSARQPLGRRWLGLAGSAVSLGALAVILAVAVAAIAVPKAAGAVPLTVLSNSMAPTMPVGSLAVVKPTMPVTAGKPEELSVEEIEQVNEVSKIEPGDVIVFAPKEGSGTTVIHRVITANTDSTGRRTFMTRGDNNDAMDPPVAGYQVRGVLWYRLPWLGWVNDAMDSSTRRVVSVAVAAAGFGWAGWTLVSALAGPKRQPRRASSATGATATQTGLRGLGPNGAKDGDR